MGSLEDLGYKRSHWIWYIFPQIAGQGFSSMAAYYAISSKDEAIAYMQDPTLSIRLLLERKMVSHWYIIMEMKQRQMIVWTEIKTEIILLLIVVMGFIIFPFISKDYASLLYRFFNFTNLLSEDNNVSESSEITITVTWIVEDQNGTRYDVDAWVESLDGSYDIYDNISSEDREGQQIITLYDLNGSYDLVLASMEEGEAPIGYFATPGAEVEIQLPGQKDPITFIHTPENQGYMCRAQTGAWLWKPCSIRAGHVEEYSY